MSAMPVKRASTHILHTLLMVLSLGGTGVSGQTLAGALDAPEATVRIVAGAVFAATDFSATDDDAVQLNAAFNSPAILEVTGQGPAEVSFDWRNDFNALGVLSFSVNGVANGSVDNADTYVTRRFIAVPAGPFSLRWTLDQGSNFGGTQAWVDNLYINTAFLEDGIDQPSLKVTTTTNGPANSGWFLQTTETFDGTDAVQSGDISNNQTSSLETFVEGPAFGSFYWRVSSEEGFDFLNFSINGSPWTTGISGETEWVKVNFWVEAGTKRLTWDYSKDVSASIGSDAAFVDRLEVWTDTDRDFVPDQDELQFFGNLTTVGPETDFDGDDLIDPAEFQRGTQYRNPDSDNDNLSDGDEVDLGLNPVVSDIGIYNAVIATLQTRPDLVSAAGIGGVTEAEAASAIAADPTKMATYGLYSAGAMQDLFLGSPLIFEDGGQIAVRLQMVRGSSPGDLTDLGQPVDISVPVDDSDDKLFFRIRATSTPQ